METRESVRKGACQRGGGGAVGCSGDEEGESADVESSDGRGVAKGVAFMDPSVGDSTAAKLDTTGLANGDLAFRSRSLSLLLPSTVFRSDPLRFLRVDSAATPAIAPPPRLFSREGVTS